MDDIEQEKNYANKNINILSFQLHHVLHIALLLPVQEHHWEEL